MSDIQTGDRQALATHVHTIAQAMGSIVDYCSTHNLADLGDAYPFSGSLDEVQADVEAWAEQILGVDASTEAQRTQG